jgi:hypothetical protein
MQTDDSRKAFEFLNQFAQHKRNLSTDLSGNCVLMGSGSYGEVRKITIEGQDFAVKTISFRDRNVSELDDLCSELKMELLILMSNTHDNVITGFGWDIDYSRQEFHIMMQLWGTSLDKILERRNKNNQDMVEREIEDIYKAMSAGLCYLGIFQKRIRIIIIKKK